MSVMNHQPSMARPTLMNMNPNELKYYPFMISLDKCTGSCNVLSPKIYAKAFNMITKKMKLKQ